jgi:uncharacterized protein involved in tolerance to divalent cations
MQHDLLVTWFLFSLHIEAILPWEYEIKKSLEILIVLKNAKQQHSHKDVKRSFHDYPDFK